jgi:hypothetical protein
MTPAQRIMWRKLGEILDVLPASDECTELLRLWYRLAGAKASSDDWQRATEILEKLDPLIVGAAVCVKTDNQSVELTQRATAILETTH